MPVFIMMKVISIVLLLMLASLSVAKTGTLVVTVYGVDKADERSDRMVYLVGTGREAKTNPKTRKVTFSKLPRTLSHKSFFVI